MSGRANLLLLHEVLDPIIVVLPPMSAGLPIVGLDEVRAALTAELLSESFTLPKTGRRLA